MFKILKGMGITLKYAFKKKYTVNYPYQKIEMFPRFRGALKLTGMMGEDKTFSPLEEMPPCMNRCPANVDARGYINLVAKGMYKEAFDLHMESNPLPSICGRVCPHPCEEMCRRATKDEAVSIAGIKRFIGDYDYEKASAQGIPDALKAPEIKREQRVAVIGAGPAGLSCAYYLAKLGYPVTIFEKLPVPGGMVYVGIPAYRLPRDVIYREVKNIENMGVEIKYNRTLGKDFSIDSLFKDGYKAVFIGVGAHKVINMRIEGEHLKGVIPGESFLADVALEKPVKIGKKVIVVGGGNTAIDCARTAKRIGATDVTIVYRRSRSEMPAHDVEIEDAIHEGIKLELLANPARIIGKKGSVYEVECTRMELGPPDASGRRSPVPVEGGEFIMETDEIISAISRVPDLDNFEESANWAKEGNIDFHEKWLTINADKLTFQTSREGVFAAGDLVTGPDIAIQAIADARKAAQGIHQYLSGTKENLSKSKFSLDTTTKPLFNEGSRNAIPEIPLEARHNNFEEVATGYDETLAQAEANRCLSCNSQQCIGCKICEVNCPNQSIEIEISQNGTRNIDKWDVSLDRCIYCGTCSEYCPTKALVHSNEYELSTDDRAKLRFNKEKMLQENRSTPVR